MNWDDLRSFLAVAASGGLSSAARKLGVNHATIQRRIGRLETSLGVRLFDRSPSGYVMTEAGEELLAGSLVVEDLIIAAEARVAGRDLNLSGPVRLTTVDSLAETVLPGYLNSFNQDYPDVMIEMVVENRVLNLTRREADIALRPGDAPQGTMTGRRIGKMGFAFYGAANARDGLITGDDSLQHLAVMKWLKEARPELPIRMKCNSFSAMSAAARAGIGITLLPCILGDASPVLQRMENLPPEMSVDLWLLVHPDIRRVARVRALLDHLAAMLKRDQNSIFGLNM